MKLRTENIEKINKVAQDLGLKCFPLEKIQPGDMYLACRNGEPELLTALEIISGKVVGGDDYIVCKELAYYYDAPECVKVVPLPLG